MGRIQFWFTGPDNKERIQLPVNPETISVSSPYGFESVEVTQVGELLVAKERGLKELTLSSFFPYSYSPLYCEYANFAKPQLLLDRFEVWRNTKQPIRLTITGTNFTLSCMITGIDYELERFGSPRDIYFSMTLREYRFVSIRKVDLSTPPATTPVVTRPAPTPPVATSPTTHIVGKNESLWTIAKKYYKDGGKWSKIYNANKSVIGNNPNRLYPGMKLTIPKL